MTVAKIQHIDYLKKKIKEETIKACYSVLQSEVNNPSSIHQSLTDVEKLEIVKDYINLIESNFEKKSTL